MKTYMDDDDMSILSNVDVLLIFYYIFSCLAEFENGYFYYPPCSALTDKTQNPLQY